MSSNSVGMHDEPIESLRPRLAVSRRLDNSAKSSVPPLSLRLVSLAQVMDSDARNDISLEESSVLPLLKLEKSPVLPLPRLDESSLLPLSTSLEESLVLPLPSTNDQQEKNIPLDCTSCDMSSPVVANCISCSTPLCANCVISHLKGYQGQHITHHDTLVGQSEQGASIDHINIMVKDSKEKLEEAQKTIHSIDDYKKRLSRQYHKAVQEVNKTYNYYQSMVAKRKLEVVKEIEKLYSMKQVSLSASRKEIQERMNKIKEMETVYKIKEMETVLEKCLQSGGSKDFLRRDSSL